MSLFDDDVVLDKVLAKLSEIKKKMMEKNLTVGRTTCPSCGNKTLICSLHDAGRRGYHMHAGCKHEGCGFISME